MTTMDQVTFAEAEHNARKRKPAQGEIPKANGSTYSLETAEAQDSTAISLFHRTGGHASRQVITITIRTGMSYKFFGSNKGILCAI